MNVFLLSWYVGIFVIQSTVHSTTAYAGIRFPFSPARVLMQDAGDVSGQHGLRLHGGGDPLGAVGRKRGHHHHHLHLHQPPVPAQHRHHIRESQQTGHGLLYIVDIMYARKSAASASVIVIYNRFIDSLADLLCLCFDVDTV